MAYISFRVVFCLLDTTVSGVASRQRSQACELRLEHQGLFLQPIDMQEWRSASAMDNCEIRNRDQERQQMSEASAPGQD